MKFFILLVVLISHIIAKEPQKVTVGLGPYIQSQPYYNVKDIVVPSPVVFFDNGIFYVRWSRAGIYFLGEKGDTFSWGFSLTAQPRPFGYKASDSAVLTGMDERESTFEGGVAFSASFHDSKYIEIMLLTDLLDRHDSWLLRTEIGDEYKLGSFTFYPSLVVMYQSQEFLNYYYGVKKSEATALRPAYTTSDGLEIGVQTYISYPFSKHFSFLTNLRYDRISTTAKNSPIVKDNYIYSGLFSLMYSFEY